MSDSMIAMLRDEYLRTQEEKKSKRREIQERHRVAIAEEVAVMEDALDKRLGEMLVSALKSGLKRKDIWKPVFGTNDNNRWSRLVRLGGGEVRTKRTGTEIDQERREALGVTQIGENLFEWTVAPGVTVEARINWFDGKPVLFPVGEGLQVSQEHGIKQADYYAKGQEVVKEFGIKEEEVGGE